MIAENIFMGDQFTPYGVVLRHALLDNQNEIAIRHGAKMELTDAWVRNMKNQQALRLAQMKSQPPVRKSLKRPMTIN
jgi:hypothetical protein